VSARAATRKPHRAGLDEAGPVAPRRRGRPRSEEAHRAILAAVIDLLGEQGLNGLTMEAVAARAGVGKTTIYRRWSNKNDLVVAALEQLPPPSGALPDQGSLLGDLKAMVALQRERLGASQLPRIMPRVLGEAMEDPELHADIVTRAVLPIRQMLTEIVERGIQRGELRNNLDVEATVDILHAIPVYKLLLAGGAMDAIADLPDRITPILLEGAASSSPGPRSARQRSRGSSPSTPGRSG
jgi:AcrR family transcriptional regulator